MQALVNIDKNHAFVRETIKGTDEIMLSATKIKAMY